MSILWLAPWALADGALHAVTPEMHAWALERAGTGLAESRLDRLLEALRDPSFGLVYDDAHTGTAREVFETRRYNCLSLTVLFVALARDLGLEADYLRVDSAATYIADGRVVLVTRHVTAGWGPPARRHVAELGVDPDTEHLRFTTLADAEVEAAWWTNRSGELVRDGAPLEAAEAARAALSLVPTLPEAWVNLGVAERHAGDLRAAEEAYRRAIELDPERLSAWRNLAMLMRLEGRAEAARELLELADRPGHRDPFVLLALGDGCLQAGDLDGAGRLYRRARLLEPHHPDVLAALGAHALAEGDEGRARRWLARARRADADNARVVALDRRLRDAG